MGFDFGDNDPEQDTPAAGFRIKSIKPTSGAGAGEPEQDKDSQDDEIQYSGVNGQKAPSQPEAETLNTGTALTGMVFELDPEKQKNENDPHNDSEVIPNIPVTSEVEAHSTGHSPAEGTRQDNHQAEIPAKMQIEDTDANTPEAEELKAASVPNIPSRLTRPTQVYAVEDKDEEPATKKENSNPGFTPASPKAAESNNTVKEEPDNPVLAAQNNNSGTVVNEPAAPQLPTAADPQAPVAEPTAVSEPAQSYKAAPVKQEDIHQEEPQHSYQEEDISTDDNSAGVSFAEPEPPKKSTRGRKSLKTLDAEAGAVAIPEDSTLFKRQYYSIGEVAGFFGVNQSLLRFWENEFDIIQPRKNRKGDRHFRPVDIKNLELIYDLLRRRKLTIEGAKEFLKKNKQARERFEMIQSLQQIKGFLLEIKASL